MTPSGCHKAWCCILCAVAMMLLCACGSGESAQAREKKHDSRETGLPPLKHSFVVHEGTRSNVTCLVVGRKGHVYAAGMSDSSCVIFKLDANLKTIREMAKFGSARGKETVVDMALDSDGNLFVTGYTDNMDFPVTKGCYDETMSSKSSYGNYEGFVVKFSPKLKLLASTFIGGDAGDRAHGIAIDRRDNVYVAGYAEGADPNYRQNMVLPPKAFDPAPAHKNQAKAFVVKLSNDLSTLKAGTLVGGNRKKYDSDDEAYDIAIDRDGHVWIAGQSNSDDFPVTRDCVGPSYAGKGDVFVAKFDAGLQRLLAATYLGGMNQELATALVLDKQGNAFVGGWTESPDLPMVDGCFDTKYSHEEEDAFIVKLSSDLKQLKAATYLSGDYDASGYGDDLLSAMALSANGKTLCVTGRTESENFPVTAKCYKNYTNDSDNPMGREDHRNDSKPRERSSSDEDWGDGFISLLDADLTQCRYSTYFGGDNLEYVDDILFDGDDLLVAGITYSRDFPRITTKEKQQTWARGFAVRFNWKKGR